MSKNDIFLGTFDTAIVSINDMGMYHVRATNGNTRTRFVDAMMEYCIDKLEDRAIEVNFDARELSIIRVECEKAKNVLSEQDTAEIVIGTEKNSINVSKFNELIKPYIIQTIGCMEQALEDADIKKEKISKLILVGGGTYTPFVRRMLAQWFGKGVDTSVNPMHAGMF